MLFCQILSLIQNSPAFLPSAEKFHYQFNLKDHAACRLHCSNYFLCICSEKTWTSISESFCFVSSFLLLLVRHLLLLAWHLLLLFFSSGYLEFIPRAPKHQWLRLQRFGRTQPLPASHSAILGSKKRFEATVDFHAQIRHFRLERKRAKTIVI